MVPSAPVMLTTAGSVGLSGVNLPSLVNAISQACLTSLAQPGTLMVTAAGTAGTGAIQGIGVIGPGPAVLSQLIVSYGASFGITGASFPQIAFAIANGVCTSLATATVQGICLGVGAGAGSAKVASMNPAIINSAILANFAMFGILGSLSANIANAISNGIATYMNTSCAVPVVAIVGPPSVAPAATIATAQLL